MNAQSVVIVGAGHSGAKAAAALRKHGWTGEISLVGDEPHVPYDRPPLSKAVLLGKKTSDQCAFFPASWFEANQIELLLGETVQSIDRSTKRVLLSDSRRLPYEKLLLATGSAINQLAVPGAELDGVWPLRTPQHADAIARSFHAGQKLVVIGAGVIGLEVAAAAVELGCDVHVLEVAPHAMARSLPLDVSSALVSEHRGRGVDIRFGVRVAALEGDGRVAAVRLDTGEVIECEVVVYGVGVRPRTELAETGGLAVDNGIMTNELLQTEDPDIFACGDVCKYKSGIFDRFLRLENWRNAEDQADTAARNMLGQGKAFDEVPWFWSNQYDLALQVAGVPAYGSLTVSGTVGAARLFLSLTEHGLLRGACALGPVRDVAMSIRKLKTMIAAGFILDVGANGESAVPLNDLIRE
ncbi:NAD(P)/FAD-dependent oxidoreductase [Rhizobium sullae]|uniref:FAD-dependent oxidoreductase n=1 Tax=Rhizobium sullae TaxID=50338 RepID=A0ABY5XXA4_RHISU|nr:FAD-dependent oxidoreductase [Rhizobium sullae]UWU19135.1 FAD-dependent oxidoreductase [Rhizobium sullae]